MEIKRLTKEELQAFARLKGCKIENLYYRGDISLLQKPEKIIALIGQRNADDNVLRNAKKYGNLLTARLLNSRAFSGFYIIKNPA